MVLPHREFVAGDAQTLLAAFDTAYRQLFGRTIDGLAVEVTNWQLAVSTVLPPVAPAVRHDSGASAPARRIRHFFDAALRQTVEAQEVDRASLTLGQAVEGPAIVVEHDTSTIVTSAFRAVGQGDGSLRLIRKEARP